MMLKDERLNYLLLKGMPWQTNWVACFRSILVLLGSHHFKKCELNELNTSFDDDDDDYDDDDDIIYNFKLNSELGLGFQL